MNKAAEQHLRKASEYIAKGDEFYRKAKPEIVAALLDPKVLQKDVARYLGKSEAWVSEVVKWDGTGTLYGKDSEQRQVRQAKQVLREAPAEQVADLLDHIAPAVKAEAEFIREARRENQTGIPRRNAPQEPTFIQIVLRVNGWLDELVGMVERGEAEVPPEFSSQSLSDIGVKAMRLKELVDDVRDAEVVTSRD